MEAKYKSLSIFEFQERFPDEASCYAHLVEVKWKEGYQCRKCGHTHYCKGDKDLDRQCTRCRHMESPTSGTLFHKVKFSILKAFWIVYYVSSNKKGIASTELSRKLGLSQKACWLFKQKVMQGMCSSEKSPMSGDVEVDEFVVGQQEEGVRGRKNDKKKLVVIAIEKRGKGISRMYAQQIDHASKAEIKGFMDRFVSKEASIRTDGWSAYKGLQSEFPNLKQEKASSKAKNFTLMHRAIMGLKAWIRGTHAQVKHLQYYLDEYTYRFNRHLFKTAIFDNLLNRMILHPPMSYKMIIA